MMGSEVLGVGEVGDREVGDGSLAGDEVGASFSDAFGDGFSDSLAALEGPRADGFGLGD